VVPLAAVQVETPVVSGDFSSTPTSSATLNGKVVVFVMGGPPSKRPIFERAKELGVKIIVVDNPDSWVAGLEKEKIVDKFVPIDLFDDVDVVVANCLDGVRRAAAALQISQLDGFTTYWEVAVPLTCRLAEKMGLPHNPVMSVDNSRDKYATRSVMEKAGLPTLKHFKIEFPEDVDKAADYIGFPAVIKPTSCVLSLGVTRVDNREELYTAYKKVTDDMRNMFGKNMSLSDSSMMSIEDADDGECSAGSWIKQVLMMEEYLDGPEVDVDLILSNGVPVFGAVTDNWPTFEPYFQETGSNCPSILPRNQQEELLDLGIKSCHALGLRMGVFHVEAKYTSRGARLLEVNPRMGGGEVRDTILTAWGVDMIEEHLKACVGIPPQPNVPKQPLKCVAGYTVNAKVSGVLQHNKYLEGWQDHPDVLYAVPLVKPGTQCVGFKDGLPTGVSLLLVAKPSVQEAIDFCKAIEESLDVPIV